MYSKYLQASRTKKQLKCYLNFFLFPISKIGPILNEIFRSAFHVAKTPRKAFTSNATEVALYPLRDHSCYVIRHPLLLLGHLWPYR